MCQITTSEQLTVPVVTCGMSSVETFDTFYVDHCSHVFVLSSRLNLTVPQKNTLLYCCIILQTGGVSCHICPAKLRRAEFRILRFKHPKARQNTYPNSGNPIRTGTVLHYFHHNGLVGAGLGCRRYVRYIVRTLDCTEESSFSP